MRIQPHGRGRAARPGPCGPGNRLRLGSAVSAATSPAAGRAYPWPAAGRAARWIAAACLAVTLAACGNPASGPSASGPPARPSPSARYGAIPTWLPTPKVPVGRTVRASPAHPWLAIEGDSVSVQLAHGQVLATAVGPAVPREGQFPLPKTTACTFTVTFTRAAGTVPLRPSAFTIVDELGRLHHPRVRIRGSGPLPGAIVTGGTVILTITDRLPAGSGQLRWSPGTSRPVVSWDFDVEID